MGDLKVFLESPLFEARMTLLFSQAKTSSDAEGLPGKTPPPPAPHVDKICGL